MLRICLKNILAASGNLKNGVYIYPLIVNCKFRVGRLHGVRNRKWNWPYTRTTTYNIF